MPFADLPNARIHYALSGNENSPTLILSNSLGTNFSMWDAQLAAFEKQFRVLRYDKRGHGESSVPPSPYSVSELTGDILALADFLHIDRFCFCGLSIGGMIGMTLALQSPERLHKLVICSTAAKIGTRESWNTRIETVRTQGMKEIARTTPQRWFTPGFIAKSPDVVAAIMRVIESMNPEGYIGGCCAVRDFDAQTRASQIRVPTLVISATHDPAAPPSAGHFLTDNIVGSRCAELNASHIANIEDAANFTAKVSDFLSE